MAEELELKLGVRAPEILDDILIWRPVTEKIVGEIRTLSMVSRYFDNENHDFSTRKWTFRHRQENQDAVITLKIGGEVINGIHRRCEWEVAGNDPKTAVPQLLDAGAPTQLVDFLEAPLVLSCGAEFTRRAILLDFGDATAELALDVGFLSKGDKKLPFQEVELELKSGNPELLMEFGEKLRETFHLYPEPKSKLARGLAL